jgi:hypothetical protein
MPVCPSGAAARNFAAPSRSRGNAAAAGTIDVPMSDDDKAPSEKIAEVNEALAEWTARSAGESEMLIQRLEGMGYAVSGKSEDEITEILKKPPTKSVHR